MRRVVFYIRVSTDGQDKAETDENQLRDLYKVYNKAEVVRVYKDTGSGADPTRASLQELREDAKKGLFDVIAVWDTSRLARDIILALTLRAEFKALGIKIEVQGKEKDDADDAKIYTLIESWMDERERDKIKSRFISGRERRLSENKLIGCYPPYGYKHIRRDKEKGTDASFQVNEKEAKIVKLIFQWYIELESMFLVAKRLMEKGIKTRGKGTEPKFFCVSMVSKILRRETYIGKHYFGKSSPSVAKYHIYKVHKHKLTGRKKNPKESWRMVNVPVIMDIETFNRAQEIVKKRAKFALKEAKHQFLSQGLVRCIDCNRHYGGRMQGKFLIYRCSQHYRANLNMPVCRSRSMGVVKLDTVIWAYVTSLIKDGERIKNSIRVLREKRENDKSSNKRVLESLLLEKTALKSKKSKLLELYAEPDSSIPKEDLALKINDFDQREKSVDTQIIEIEKELRDIEGFTSMEAEIEKTCLIYQQKINNCPFELKKYIVRKWIEEIFIEKDGSIKIKVRVPQGEIIEETKKEFLYNLPNPSLSEGSQINLRFEEVIQKF